MLPERCDKLTDCIRGLEDKQRAYDSDETLVTADMVKEQPGFAAYQGQRLLQVSFMLQDCRIGGSLIFRREKQGAWRLISGFYLAG